GFGKLANQRIEPHEVLALQENLLRSHAVGMGSLLSLPVSRLALALRIQALVKGYSGVTVELIEQLIEMYNRGVVPAIPELGSVGASGDLAPLAHLVLPMLGEGQVLIADRSGKYSGAHLAAADALREAGIKPLVLEAKEAVSLINGTQGMLSVGVLALLAAEVLADSADIIGALSLDALRGTDAAFDSRIHQVRPHPGQLRTAENLRRLLEGSQIRESHRDCARVQDAYSLRCMPQVHGAVRDTLAHCRRVLETEINSAVDNPLVFAPAHRPGQKDGVGEGNILSGGNFHGEPVAFALDFLGIALTSLAGISERRLERLVNPALNEGLPPFLAPGAGLNSGFMMAQVTAAALASENKVLAHPASVDSITTSGNKEDYVSMGMAASLKLRQIVANTRHVLAIEAMAAAQGIDFLAPLKTSKRLQAAHAAIRSVSPPIEHDRVLADDFARISDLIASGKVADVLR
ncbi:MAG TPA: histidine ammonia-lyase, partial [Terriglobales bacterium]